MTNEHKSNPWLFIAAGLVVAIITAIVADQIKTNKALETPCPVASQSASSRVDQPPEPVPSSEETEATPIFRDTIIKGKHYQVPVLTDCSESKTCHCWENGVPCIMSISSGDQNATKGFVCSHGLWVTSEEYDLFGDTLYRNACRPPGEPVLKSCRFGEICAPQGIKEGERCMAEHEQLSICHCGMVFNFSTPDLRKDADQIQCLMERTREPPPDPSIHL
ncbi:MAG: hypothetical protein PHC70_01315 [Patescibacteria group bacterium]|nr:hypothetical protein [Patescibacteria group bacterium]